MIRTKAVQEPFHTPYYRGFFIFVKPRRCISSDFFVFFRHSFQFLKLGNFRKLKKV